MVDVSRRELMVSAAAAAALAGGVSSIAVAQTATSAAAWDLSELYPSDISERLRIDYFVVLDALEALKAKGRIEY